MEKISTIKILITGVESSGKSTLAAAIQARFDGILVHEYARTYCEVKTDAISKEDVIHIGDQQLKEYHDLSKGSDLVIFDTNILTTIIWLKDKFNARLKRFHEGLNNQQYDLILLCAPDLAWEEDGIREDGHRLTVLHKRYLAYLKKYDLTYTLIFGSGEERVSLAFEKIHLLINKQ